MSAIWITLKRELAAHFYSPVAYVIAVLFYFIRGFEVLGGARRMAAFGTDRDFFSTAYIFNNTTSFMVMLVPPILTMRAFAEERRTGSLEVLLTAPVRDRDVVLGKLLAAIAFFAILWLPTLPLLGVLTMSPFIDASLAPGPVLSGYLGLFLLGAFYLSVGCFTSSLTDNVLLAAILAMLFNVLSMQVLPSGIDILAGTEFAKLDWVQTLFSQMHITEHLQSWFARGLVDSSKVMFYVLGTAFFAFLTIRSLESRTWR